MKIENIIEVGSLKQAQLYLAYKEKEYEKLEAQRQQEAVQAQSQAIQDQQARATEGRVVEAKANSENKKDEMATKAYFDVQEYERKGEIIKEQDDNKSSNKIKEDLLKG